MFDNIGLIQGHKNVQFKNKRKKNVKKRKEKNEKKFMIKVQNLGNLLKLKSCCKESPPC